MAYCQVKGDRNVLQILEKLWLKSMLVRGRMAGCKICKLLDIILTRSMNEQEASRGDPVVLVHPKLDSLLHVLVFPDFPFFPSLQL
jgi:hypothetical protein